jgi:hypothetical protein
MSIPLEVFMCQKKEVWAMLEKFMPKSMRKKDREKNACQRA